MTPRYSRLEAAERRDQILDAANTLFAERGYDAVRIDDIATSAGVTRGLVHHYFGGRKEVCVGLLERLGDVREGQLRPPRGTQWARAGGGLGVAMAGLDRGEPSHLPRDHRPR